MSLCLPAVLCFLFRSFMDLCAQNHAQLNMHIMPDRLENSTSFADTLGMQPACPVGGKQSYVWPDVHCCFLARCCLLMVGVSSDIVPRPVASVWQV